MTPNLDVGRVTPVRNARKGERFPSRFAAQVGIALALPVVLIAAWWISSANSDNFFLPPLSEIVSLFGPTWLGDRLLEDVVPSMVRLVSGYLVALVLGVAIGMLVGVSTMLRELTEPVFEFFRAIPPPVLIPILLLIFGIGPAAQVLVIGLACFWPILLNTVDGIRGIDHVLLDTARSYRIRGLSRWGVLLRGASPQIATGARQALSLGIILMVVSEMFAATDGIGRTIVAFQRGFSIPEMWTGIILLGLIGVLLSIIFRCVERSLLGWYYGFKQSERGGS
jgi:ABC-type nitrate/sulfonate/bicarbonate transport system permease component